MRLARNIITIIYTLLVAILLIGLYEWIYKEHYEELDLATSMGVIGLSLFVLIPSIIAWLWHYKIGIIQGKKKYLLGTGYTISLVAGVIIISIVGLFVTAEQMKDTIGNSPSADEVFGNSPSADKLNRASFEDAIEDN